MNMKSSISWGGRCRRLFSQTSLHSFQNTYTMESSGGSSTPTRQHQDAEAPSTPQSASSAASSVTAVNQASSQTWGASRSPSPLDLHENSYHHQRPDGTFAIRNLQHHSRAGASSPSAGTASSIHAGQRRDFTIIPPGWPHASSGWAPGPLPSEPASVTAAAPYLGRNRMPSYVSTSSWPRQAHSSRAARQQPALGLTRGDEKPAQGGYPSISGDDDRARSGTPGNMSADTPTAPSLPGNSQLFDTAGDQDTFDTSNASGMEEAGHLESLQCQLRHQEELGTYRAARNGHPLSRNFTWPRQMNYQAKAQENLVAPDSPRSSPYETDGVDRLSMPTKAKGEEEKMARKRDGVAGQVTVRPSRPASAAPAPSSPQRRGALAAQYEANIRAYERQLQRELDPARRPRLGLAVTALRERLAQQQQQQQPAPQPRPLRRLLPPVRGDNPEAPPALGGSPVPVPAMARAPRLRRRPGSDRLHAAFQRQGDQPDSITYYNTIDPDTRDVIQPDGIEPSAAQQEGQGRAGPLQARQTAGREVQGDSGLIWICSCRGWR